MKKICYAVTLLSFCLYSLMAVAKGEKVFDFTESSEASKWMVVNDGVMGGISRSRMIIDDGVAHFLGYLSLENNGGFASVRRLIPDMSDSRSDTVTLRVKGDGRPYQLRIRTDRAWDGVSYRALFDTNDGEWLDITLKASDFSPVFRGRPVRNVPELRFQDTKQLGFLLADKRTGEFHLEVSQLSFR